MSKIRTAKNIIITELPLTKIQPNELNDYDKYDSNNILKKSIEVFGMDSALAVIGPFEGDMYRLISGERRYYAVLQINKETNGACFGKVPVVIVGDSTMDIPTQIAKIRINNITTRKMTAESIKKYGYISFRTLKSLQEKGIIESAVNEFAELFQQSIRTAQMYQRVVNMEDEIEGYVSAVTILNIPLIQAGQIGERLKNADEKTKRTIRSERKTLVEKLTAAKNQKEKEEILLESEIGKAILINKFLISGKSYKNIKGSSNEMIAFSEEIFLQKMIRWCNALLERDEISQKEKEVVEVFRKVTNKFK